MSKLKIWHINDTHTLHGYLKIPEGINMVIHGGDISNPREVVQSTVECLNFIEWYKSLPIKYKILVAGNHDIAIERRTVTPADFAQAGIIYLENASTIIEGFKIWGSPITPSFGDGWAFNKDRGKCYNVWETIPEDTDIVVTHGPAKGILDMTYDRQGNFERCGCNALKNRIIKINPKLFCFGHIHDFKDITNAGYMKIANCDTIFSNGAVVEDGRFSFGPINNGNIFELEKEV